MLRATRGRRQDTDTSGVTFGDDREKDELYADLYRRHAGFGWHKHNLDFQIYYVLRGWVKFDYEGVGEVTAEAGSCVHQPPGIRHAEVAHSDDLELLEITLPAEFETVETDAPAGAAKKEPVTAG